jgi:hypothetical protein
MAYNNYTLFDLYEVVLSNDIQMPSILSKDTLISTIEAEKIVLQPKDKQEIDWFLSRMCNSYIICIAFDSEEFYIQEEDIIICSDNKYLICTMYFDDNSSDTSNASDTSDNLEKEEDLMILLKNINTEEYTQVKAMHFVKSLSDDNIVYEYSTYIDCRFG